MTDLYFIHGMWGTPAVWSGLRARFEAVGYTTHAPALPFHDRRREEPPPPEIAALGLKDYIDYLVEDVSRLATPPIIIGHSMGGFLAQAVAARVQPAGLILLSPAASASTPAIAADPVRTVWKIISHWGWWKRPTMMEPDAARWGLFNEVPADIASAEIAALVWDSGRVLADLSFPWLTRNGAATVDYARLSMPALVVVGTEDRVTPVTTAKATARRLTGPVDYHELPDTGHWLFHPAAVGRVGDLIAEWLAPIDLQRAQAASTLG